MFNINDIQKYAQLKMEIFLKQPRDIVDEIEKELAQYSPSYCFGKDERYLLYYALCEEILFKHPNDFIVEMLTRSIKQEDEVVPLYLRLTKLRFPKQIVIDVCVDILKGK